MQSIGQNPLIGTGVAERGLTGGSENSLLFGTATFGLGMGFLILVLMSISAVIVVRLWRYRRYMDPFARRITDLIVAANLMYFGGSIFEGYILARVGSLLVFLLIFGAMGTRMLADVRDATVPVDDELEWSEAGDEIDVDEYDHSDWSDATDDDVLEDSL